MEIVQKCLYQQNGTDCEFTLEWCNYLKCIAILQSIFIIYVRRESKYTKFVKNLYCTLNICFFQFLTNSSEALNIKNEVAKFTL